MRNLSLLAAALLLLPPAEAASLGAMATMGGANQAADSTLLARAGGGRAGGGGAARGGGGGGRAQRANTGMDRTPRSFDRGNRQPSGGWSRDVSNRPDRARPSLDRGAVQGNRVARPAAADRMSRPSGVSDRMSGVNRDAIRDRTGSIDRQAVQNRVGNATSRDNLRDRTGALSRDDWDRAGDRLQNGVNERRDNLSNARDNLRDNWNDRTPLNNGLNVTANRYNNYWPGWARPGWNLARPWNWGWYGGWVSPPWGWWAARSVAWGVTSLATAAMINNAVNSAIASSQTLIVVPDSSYQLYYNSIQPTGDQTITFVAIPNGGEAITWTADCRSGSLNGYQPAGAAEAQLLNAACQVAFGS